MSALLTIAIRIYSRTTREVDSLTQLQVFFCSEVTASEAAESEQVEFTDEVSLLSLWYLN